MSTHEKVRTEPRKDERFLVLYDGRCAFCTAQQARLVRLAAHDKITVRDFQKGGSFEDLPGITYEQCMKAMLVVAPSGDVYQGAEAIARALTTRSIFWIIAWTYWVPGFHWLFDQAYAAVARRRYRLMKKSHVSCDGNVCALHAPEGVDP